MTRTSDTQIGAVANGSTYRRVTIGSGYDVTIRRESEQVAIVSIARVGSTAEWLLTARVNPSTDLQQLAIEIAQFPHHRTSGRSFGAWISPSSAAWDRLAGRYDALA